ncbi:hypothetical protein MKX03_001293, partial [Papaver bracteatum]
MIEGNVRKKKGGLWIDAPNNCFSSPPLISRGLLREVIVTSSVLACEVTKNLFSMWYLCTVYHYERRKFEKNIQRVTLIDELTASGLPAAIYALQNSLLQISYKNLDSLTISMINHIKLLFTDFFTYLILSQKQSVQQIGGFMLLILTAILLSVGEGKSKGSSGSDADVKKHSSYLMTIEMSVVGSMCLLESTYKSPDGEQIKKHEFFYGWTAFTLILALTNVIGGILVGIITAHAGG